MSAYEMAATVEFGHDAKQGLLDLRSETARMKLFTRLCRAAIKRLDFIDRAQSRARSNGKVNFSGLTAPCGEQQLLNLSVLVVRAPRRAACNRPAGRRSGPPRPPAARSRTRSRRPPRRVDRAHAERVVGVGVGIDAGGEDRPHRRRAAEEGRQVQRREAVAAAHGQVGLL